MKLEPKKTIAQPAEAWNAIHWSVKYFERKMRLRRKRLTENINSLKNG